MNTACKTLILMLVMSLAFMTPNITWASSRDYDRSSVSETDPVVNKSSEETIPVRRETVSTGIPGWFWAVLVMSVTLGLSLWGATSKKSDSSSK